MPCISREQQTTCAYAPRAEVEGKTWTYQTARATSAPAWLCPARSSPFFQGHKESSAESEWRSSWAARRSQQQPSYRPPISKLCACHAPAMRLTDPPYPSTRKGPRLPFSASWSGQKRAPSSQHRTPTTSLDALVVSHLGVMSRRILSGKHGAGLKPAWMEALSKFPSGAWSTAGLPASRHEDILDCAVASL